MTVRACARLRAARGGVQTADDKRLSFSVVSPYRGERLLRLILSIYQTRRLQFFLSFRAARPPPPKSTLLASPSPPSLPPALRSVVSLPRAEIRDALSVAQRTHLGNL